MPSIGDLVLRDLDARRLVDSIVGQRREFELLVNAQIQALRFPQIVLADVEAGMKAIYDINSLAGSRVGDICDALARRHQELFAGLNTGLVESFQRSMTEARPPELTIAELVTNSDIWTYRPPEPPENDRVEELTARVAALEAALTPPEPPKEEEDDRPLPGQYL